jgi:hypothetical protein
MNQQEPPKFKSIEDNYIFNLSLAQTNLLDQVERYLAKHGKEATLDFIRALKDSLK